MPEYIVKLNIEIIVKADSKETALDEATEIVEAELLDLHYCYAESAVEAELLGGPKP